MKGVGFFFLGAVGFLSELCTVKNKGRILGSSGEHPALQRLVRVPSFLVRFNASSITLKCNYWQ